MSEFCLQVAGWLPRFSSPSAETETFGSLQIMAGAPEVILTEVQDTLAHTVRPHINVCSHDLARWFLVNWWRLRWEARLEQPSYEWRQSHSMSAIGQGYAWPNLTFSSDGEYIQLELVSDRSPDACAIRYLRDVVVDVPARDFERALDEFFEVVGSRLAARLPEEREFSSLFAELQQERDDPSLARACKYQALAGFDPGSAPPTWLEAVDGLSARLGHAGTEEALAASTRLSAGLAGIESLVSALEASPIAVDLSRLPDFVARERDDLPWRRGARAAQALRTKLGVPRGRLTRDCLEELLGVRLPLEKSTWRGGRSLLGALRHRGHEKRTGVILTTDREPSQRFFLARLIAAAHASSPEENLLAVSDATTAFQKFQRSFAQEFLCPWTDLDSFTNESGTDDDGVLAASEAFCVSERLVLTTLVNKGKLPRERLFCCETPWSR